MRPTRRGLLVLAAAVTAAAAIVLGTMPAHGSFDGETFSCGGAFHFVDQGYGGTPGLSDCERRRVWHRVLAVGAAVLSIALIATLSRAYGPRRTARGSRSPRTGSADGYRHEMTTTPSEPVQDPDYDPVTPDEPTPQPAQPGEDPGTPDPDETA